MTITPKGDQRKTVAINRPPSGEAAGFSASLVGRFVADLQAASAGQSALPDLLMNLAGCFRKHSACLGLWYICCKADGTFDQAHSLLADDAEVELLWQTFQPQIVCLAESALAQRCLASQTIQGSPSLTAIAQPVTSHQEKCLLFGIFENTAKGSHEQKSGSPADVQWMIAHAASKIENWQSVHCASLAEMKAKSLIQAAQLNRALDATQNRVEACMTFVNVLRTTMQCSQVALALRDGRKQALKLVAVSDVDSFDRDNPACQAITTLLTSKIEGHQQLENPVLYGKGSRDADPLDREVIDYCDAVECEACVVHRLQDSQGAIFGALLLGGMKTDLEDEGRLSILKQLVELVGGHLAVVLKSHCHPIHLVRKSLGKILRQRGMKIAAAVVVLLCAVLAIPRPIGVACHSEVQPVLRRFIAAPHDGILETVLVGNGEVVRQGQLLARLDGRQIRIELASRKAELNSQRKQRDSALAVRDVAKSQIASLEMRRLQAEIDLLNRRLSNLEITSPLDGVILNGDLEKAEGAPLSMGQNLFEISPLSELLAEIAIPEADIQYVQEQMHVDVKLDAFPFKKWSGTIEKIHPRAEIVEDRSVFIAEVRMANDNGLIKPGMQGRASIRGEYYPLAWALVRRPWEQIRGYLIW